ncbi:hypothetical protein ONE63_006712 [Megalurothrips usitatus]|uniref:Uncharacterized protein n=1 Tax=Megalurothrips usitatus TaxID=439358 RepID=A0AAV7XU73_9NEOP|nr:hypothetical protein ONE63_006712 [Megalurothrips usitatus]
MFICSVCEQPSRSVEGDNVDDSNDSNDSNDNDSVNNYFINDNDVMNNENPRFTLENFVNNLYSDVQLFLAQLYCIPGVSRQLVDEIVNGTSELLAGSISNLKDNVFHFISSFQDVPENYAVNILKLENMFSTLEKPFQFMNTEHQRFRSLSESGCFIRLVRFEMGNVDTYEKSHNGGLELVQKTIYGQMIPIRHALKAFLKLNGMFHSIREYVDRLGNDDRVSNFVQGTLWRELGLPFNQEGKFVLPLHLEYDDYEPDNAIGSHHTAHSLGALCATIPCPPPELQSQLDNMFTLTIF